MVIHFNKNKVSISINYDATMITNITDSTHNTFLPEVNADCRNELVVEGAVCVLVQEARLPYTRVSYNMPSVWLSTGTHTHTHTHTHTQSKHDTYTDLWHVFGHINIIKLSADCLKKNSGQ